VGCAGGKLSFVREAMPGWGWIRPTVAAVMASTLLALAFIDPAGLPARGPLAHGARSATPAGPPGGLPGPTARAPVQTATGAPGVSLFQSLGSWVDIYEHASFRDPERAVRRMANHGVRTLYLETSNFNRKVAIKWPGRERRFIRAAHAEGMRIVAWYLPGFLSVRTDFHRVMAAIRFMTGDGQRFDGFALDIESPAVHRPAVRTKRLVALSERIRSVVGPDYPLGAIIPTPLGMKQNPSYWPGFPYRRLHALYRAFLPMTYFTWRVSGGRGAYRYTAACVDIIRSETEDPAVPIHVIGGISDDSTIPEARGFVRAVRGRHVTGASYYAFHGTSNALWEVLQSVVPLPLSADSTG
jgi:hypothetical protein